MSHIQWPNHLRNGIDDKYGNWLPTQRQAHLFLIWYDNPPSQNVEQPKLYTKILWLLSIKGTLKLLTLNERKKTHFTCQIYKNIVPSIPVFRVYMVPEFWVSKPVFVPFYRTTEICFPDAHTVQRINFGVCVVSELMNEAKECHRKSFFFVQDKEDHEQREKHVFIVCIKEKERQQQKHASKHLFILAGSRIFGTNSAVFHSVSVL